MPDAKKKINKYNANLLFMLLNNSFAQSEAMFNWDFVPGQNPSASFAGLSF
jgi:hypothetical protein